MRVWWLAVVGILCALVGCNSFLSDVSEHEPLRLWHAYRGAEKQALDQVVAAFEAQEGVQVEVLQLPADGYASKIGAAAPHGDGPDVFIDQHNNLGDYRDRGAIAAHDFAVPESVQGRYADAISHEGKRYGLPIALKTYLLYLNPELLPEAPATIEELAELRARLPQDQYPLVYQADNAYYHASLMAAFGVRQVNEDGSFGFHGPEAAKSVELVKSFVDRSVVPDETSGTLTKNLFTSGRAAAVIDGPWFAGDLPKGMKLTVAPLPKVAATGKPMRPYLTVEAALLTPRGKRRPAAKKLLEFLAGVESSRVRAKVGRQLVAREDLWPSADEDAFLATFAEQSKSAIVMPATARMKGSFEPAQHAIKKVLSGNASASEALDQARSRFDRMFRPLPERKSPAPLLIVVGLLLLAGALRLVQQARRGLVWRPLKESLPAYRWVAHAVVIVGLLVFLPVFVGAAASLFAGPQGDLHYVGLANFIDILTARGGPIFDSGSFYLVLLVTVAWTLLNVFFHITIGFTLGLLLSRPTLRLKPVYRVLLIIPWAVPSYVTALAWKGMFNRQFGAVSALVEAVGGEPFSWWTQFSTAFSANVATNVWLGFPFMMVVTLGALTAVPKDVLEAAKVDGATRWQRLTKVTIPMVVPVLGPAVLLGSIWTFNMFNVVFLVSGGEPDGTTDILVSEAYRWAFTRQAQYGYAAAYAVLIFILLFAFSRLTQKAPAEAAA